MNTLKIPVDLFPSVDSHLQHHRLFHSEFQIDCFVTARGGHHHPWGMYVQCLRELHARRSTMSDCDSNLGKNEIDIRESRWKLGRRVWTKKGGFERQREVLRLEGLLRAKQSYKKHFHETHRELKRFLEQANQLRKIIGEIPLTQERMRELDSDYWLHRLKMRVAMGLMANGQSPADVVDMLPSLDVEVQQPLMEFMANVNNPAAAKSYFASLIPTSPLALRSA